MPIDTKIEDLGPAGSVLVCALGVPAVVVVITAGACAATDKSLQVLADERFDERMNQKWVKER